MFRRGFCGIIFQDKKKRVARPKWRRESRNEEMIKLFPGLRIAEIVCYGLVLMYIGWLYEGGMDPVLAGLAALVAVAVVAFAIRLRAVMMHQKLVNILYKWLEPARFIAAYEPLLKKAAGKPALESTIRNYLSTG